MAPVVMAAQANTDLKFLLTKEEVSEAVQTTLYEAGVTTVKQFAALVKDEEELRALGATTFGLGDMTTLANKVKMANLLCAYNAAKARTSELYKVDAENEVRMVPKVVLANDFNALRTTYKVKYGALEDSRTPGRSYYEKRVDSLERSDFRAETLSEVINFRQDDARELKPVWDSSGSLKSIKTETTIPLPANTEELRSRIHLLGTAWMFASFAQAGNHVVKDLTPGIFSAYLDYLLGEHAWGLTAKGPDGGAVTGPSWALLLSYEQEIRSKAYSLVCTEGCTLADALVKAWKDEEVRSRYLVTPLALQHTTGRGVVRPYQDESWAGGSGDPRPRKAQKTKSGNGKGGGKNGGKGAAKGADKGAKSGKRSKPEGCEAQTPEGVNICFAFNSGGCSGKKCNFAHVCGKCFKKGVPIYKCDHKN